MRVTSNLIYSQSALSMQKANERYLEVQEKIAEQSDIIRPSDDPNGAAQLLRYDADTQLLEQYDQNMTLASNSLEYESVALESLTSTLDEINVLLISSANGAYSQDDLDTTAGEMEALLASVADLMNSKNSNGKYIFAGTNSSSPAFVLNSDGEYEYAGNEAQQMSQIGSTVTLQREGDEDKHEYTIVGSTEADPMLKKISNESPVGMAILGKKVKDVVKVKTPGGFYNYTILTVS